MKKLFTGILTVLCLALGPLYAGNFVSKSSTYQSLAEQNVYSLSIDKEYLEYIIAGKKIFEGRLDRPGLANIKPGDYIYFYDTEGTAAVCLVKSVYRFPTFTKMLVSSGVINMLPQIDPNTNNAFEMVAIGDEIYRSFPGYRDGIEIYGAIAFGIQYIDSGSIDDKKIIHIE